MMSLVLIILVATIVLSYLLKSDKRKNIRGQVALVTGGASGIGREIAFKLAEKGCHIVIVDVDLVNAQKTAEEIRKKYSKGIKVKAYKVDVSNESEVRAVKTAIAADGFDNVDILINNAAILFEAPLLEERSEHLERMLRVNFLSIIWTIRTFLPEMIKNQRGHLVSLASLSALHGAPKMLMYGSTKFAIRGFMDILENELYLDGHSKYIKTTTIFPSFTRSNPEIDVFLSKKWNLPKLVKVFESTQVAERIIDAIETEQNIVIIPSLFKIFGYYITIPLAIRKLMFRYIQQ